MAGWVAKFLPSNDSQPKDTGPDTELENQAVSSTGVRGGRIVSFISGLLWSGDDTSVDSNSRGAEFHQESGREYQRSVFQEPNDTFDKSWEDVDMAELKSKAASQPRIKVSNEYDCCEVGQQLSDLQQKLSNLEGVVETQGKQIKDQQKSKWPIRLRKQPSKDKGDECAQAIQARETQIREKESEIRVRDEQIEHYRKKLDRAEALDEQSAKLALELSEKENKLQEVSRQLYDLKQEMKTIMAKNARLKEQILENQTQHEDEIKKLKAKFKQEAHSDAAVEFVFISDAEQNVPSVKEELARLRSRTAALEADLEKSVTHSKGQSREIAKLKQEIQAVEVEKNEHLQSSQGLLDATEGRVSQLQQQLGQVRHERDNLKREHDKLTAELQRTHQAYQTEAKKSRLLEAQLDDDLAQCPKAKCIKIKKDYDTLATENERLQQKIAHVSDEHQEEALTISSLKMKIEDLNGKLAAANMQIQSYKFDFEDERKDREVAHGKLADLENELAREKGRNDVERATYEKQYQKLEKEKGELERKVDKLRSDLAKQKMEVEKLRDEVKAKVSQVRQYKKENDRLKAQVDQSLSSMLKLTEEMDAMKKRAEKKGSKDLLKKPSTPALPDPSMAADKKVAEMEKICDRFQMENAELRSKLSLRNDEVENLTNINRELKKLFKQDPNATQPEKDSSAVSPTQDDYSSLGDQLSDQPQSLGTESQTVGTGELHRPIPKQLPLSAEDHPRAKPTSAPLRATDPGFKYKQPHQTVPLYAPTSPSPITQGENIAEASNVRVSVQPVGQNQLGSPQHVPTGSNLKTSYNNNPQSTHQSKALNQYSGATAGGYGYDNTKHYAREEHVSGNLNPINRPPTTGEVSATNYDPNQYTGGSQSATYQLQSGAGYQHTASNSAPQYQYEAQSQLGGQPQHHSQSRSHKPPPPDCEPNQSAMGNERQESRRQQRYQPTPDSEPSHETVVKTETVSGRSKKRSEQHTQQKPGPNQPSLPPEDYLGEDDEDLRFQNRLQNEVDDEIHHEASEVMQQVSGGRRNIMTDRRRPFDPNLVCPMCMKRFRIGEIQKFKHHVSTCDGTDDTII